jgi:hypothetical protein
MTKREQTKKNKNKILKIKQFPAYYRSSGSCSCCRLANSGFKKNKLKTNFLVTGTLAGRVPAVRAKAAAAALTSEFFSNFVFFF